MRVVLLVDGENLRHYVVGVLKNNGVKGVDINKLDFDGLFNKVLRGIKLSKKVFYSAKLHEHVDTPRKSRRLIVRQRSLKSRLEKYGFDYVISGHVRGQKVDGKFVFREKGVDVRIATDLLVIAYEKKTKLVVLCSSDSDLQPAIHKAREKGLRVIYLGFEVNSNKGLMYTTDRSILIRNSEVVESYG